MNAIIIEKVSKKFRIFYDRGSTLKEKILFRNRSKYEDRWVLNDIDLNIEKGEVIGLIGENGCGKSTLLKLMTRIIYPDKGNVVITGKVSSLLELGAGFHPDMTGRENIYMNASIFGLNKETIDRKLDDIIEFSELQDFIDNPVRTYSSGMYMRLAFSVAINVEAEILLIDEILAVGDVNFQTKCFSKLKEFKRNRITIVIVSHDLATLEKVCDKIVWLKNGYIEKIGQNRETIDEYKLFMANKSSHANKSVVKDNSSNSKGYSIENIPGEDLKHWGNRNIEILEVKLLNSNKEVKELFIYGEELLISIKYKVNTDVPNPIVGIQIFNSDLVTCYGTHTKIDNIELNLKETGTINFHIKKLEFISGRYCVDIAITDEFGTPCDYHNKIYYFDMFSSLNDIGIYRPEHDWEVI